MTITLDLDTTLSLITDIEWFSNILAIGVALAIGVIWYTLASLVKRGVASQIWNSRMSPSDNVRKQLLSGKHLCSFFWQRI